MVHNSTAAFEAECERAEENYRPAGTWLRPFLPGRHWQRDGGVNSNTGPDAKRL